MNGRLATLEQRYAPPPKLDAEAHERLITRIATKLSDLAERLHEGDERRARSGEPAANPADESPAMRLVRRAMRDAEHHGPWGSAARGRAFWLAIGHELRALLNERDTGGQA